jgi:hypothetical protein
MPIHLSRYRELGIQRLSKTKILGLYGGIQIVFWVVTPCSLVSTDRTTTLCHNPGDHKLTNK